MRRAVSVMRTLRRALSFVSFLSRAERKENIKNFFILKKDWSVINGT